jgi:hypothetical protein
MTGSAAISVIRRLQLEQLTVGGFSGGSTFDGDRRIADRGSVCERVERQAEREEETHRESEQTGFARAVDRAFGGSVTIVNGHGTSSGKPLSLRLRLPSS